MHYRKHNKYSVKRTNSWSPKSFSVQPLNVNLPTHDILAQLANKGITNRLVSVH